MATRTPAEASSSSANAALAFFTRDEAATIEAAMGRIFPDDDLGAGAVAAGTVTYLDRTLAGAELRHQGLYRQGIRLLDAAARARHGQPFVACAPAAQDAMIAALADNSLFGPNTSPSAQALFDALRAHTIEGMFSDPVHGGNRDFAGWKLLGYPGAQPSYTHAEQQLDAAIVRDRIYSAVDYPLRDAGGKS